MVTVHPEWFDANVYYANKLASLGEAGSDVALKQAFLDSGYTLDPSGLYRHFLDYGNAENISPNFFFDPKQYLTCKTAQFYSVITPIGAQKTQVAQLIQESGMTLWEHYDRYGWQEGVNPSDSFDNAAYLADKLEMLGPSWTMEQLVQTMEDAGLNPVTHYSLYGKEEGLTPAAVTPEITELSTLQLILVDVVNASLSDQPLQENPFDSITFSFTPYDSDDEQILTLQMREEDASLYQGATATYATLLTALEHAIADAGLADILLVEMGGSHLSQGMQGGILYEIDAPSILLIATEGRLDFSTSSLAQGFGIAESKAYPSAGLAFSVHADYAMLLVEGISAISMANIQPGGTLDLSALLDGTPVWGSGVQYIKNNGVALLEYDHEEDNHNFTVEEVQALLPGLAYVEPYAKSIVIVRDDFAHSLFLMENDGIEGIEVQEGTAATPPGQGDSITALGTFETSSAILGASGEFVLPPKTAPIPVESRARFAIANALNPSTTDTPYEDNPLERVNFWCAFNNGETKEVTLTIREANKALVSGPDATIETLAQALRNAIYDAGLTASLTVEIQDPLLMSGTTDGQTYTLTAPSLEFVLTGGALYPIEHDWHVWSNTDGLWVESFSAQTALKLSKRFGSMDLADIPLEAGDVLDVTGLLDGAAVPGGGTAFQGHNGVTLLEYAHSDINHVFSSSELQAILPGLSAVAANVTSLVIVRDDYAHTVFRLHNDAEKGISFQEIENLGTVTSPQLAINASLTFVDASDLVPNYAPTITGVPESVVQHVSLNRSVGLADFQVHDVNNDILHVSLVLDSGLLSGVHDEDASLPGIQLSGKAHDINAALSELLFTAESGGYSSLGITVSDGQEIARAEYTLYTPSEYTLQLSDSEYLRVIGVTPSEYDFQLDANGKLTTTDPLSLIYDAEKDNVPDNGDDYLCWAASTANILAWSGWTQELMGNISYPTLEDDVFTLFKENFTDEGAHSFYGLAWFFTGEWAPPDTDEWAQLTKSASGNFIAEIEKTPGTYALTEMQNFPDILEYAIDLGVAPALGVSFRMPDDLDTILGGHAITLWGYTYNPEISSPDRITGLIISDSDSDKTFSDPRQAPDKLTVIDVHWNAQQQAYISTSYAPRAYTKIDNLMALYPNSYLYDPVAYDMVANMTQFYNYMALTVDPVGVPVQLEPTLEGTA